MNKAPTQAGEPGSPERKADARKACQAATDDAARSTRAAKQSKAIADGWRAVHGTYRAHLY